MENSTIEIKMINQENGEVTEIKFSTDEIERFKEIADALIETFYRKY